MSEGAYVAIALRLILPLLIFRKPLVGGVVSMLLDGADVIIADVISPGGGGFGKHYSAIDKGLDTYYLSIELIVAVRWANPWARWPAIGLFAYRLVGVIAFEVTGTRVLLFIFPNLFEHWWLYCVFVQSYSASLVPRSTGSVVVPLLLLLVPKMGQEWLLHYTEATPWNWTKETLLGMKK